MVAGMAVLLWLTLSEVGGGDAGSGLRASLATLPPGQRTIIPLDSLKAFHQWLGLFAAGSLGLIASQDILQRVFAARSARTAAWSCAAAGIGYLAFGAVPVLLGLATRALPGWTDDTHIVAALAKASLNPALRALFLLALVSTILSTLDGAILAPSAVLAQNLLRHWTGPGVSVVALTRAAALGVTVSAVLLARAGENAFSLLEASYSSGMALFVVLCFAVRPGRPASPAPAIGVLVLGLAVWAAEQGLGWRGLTFTGRITLEDAEVGLPFPLVTLGLGFAIFGVAGLISRPRENGGC